MEYFVVYMPRHRVLCGGSEVRREVLRLLPSDMNPSREPATHVWLVLWKAAQAIRQNTIRSLSALGLRNSDFAELEVLLHMGPERVNIIGEMVMPKNGSIPAAVDRLDSKKLLSRTTGPEDRRSQVVNLTKTGRHVIKRAFPKHAMDMEETMSILRSSDRAKLIRSFKR